MAAWQVEQLDVELLGVPVPGGRGQDPARRRGQDLHCLARRPSHRLRVLLSRGLGRWVLQSAEETLSLRTSFLHDYDEVVGEFTGVVEGEVAVEGTGVVEGTGEDAGAVMGVVEFAGAAGGVVEGDDEVAGEVTGTGEVGLEGLLGHQDPLSAVRGRSAPIRVIELWACASA